MRLGAGETGRGNWAAMKAPGVLWSAALARRMRCRRKAALGRVRVRVTAWALLGFLGRPRRLARLRRGDLETGRLGVGESGMDVGAGGGLLG